jgi:hypothetical protein
MEQPAMATGPKKSKNVTTHAAKAKLAPAEKRSFSPDRRGESSAGAMGEDKKRAVVARRDGSNTR